MISQSTSAKEMRAADVCAAWLIHINSTLQGRMSDALGGDLGDGPPPVQHLLVRRHVVAHQRLRQQRKTVVSWPVSI